MVYLSISPLSFLSEAESPNGGSLFWSDVMLEKRASTCSASTCGESPSLSSFDFPEDEVEDKMTTIMVRHIPFRYTQEELMLEISKISPGFDFFYLPVQGRGNAGYAVINFRTEKEAHVFMEAFQNYRFRLHPNRIPTLLAEVTYAANQGKA